LPNENDIIFKMTAKILNYTALKCKA
jgi:hypothetical protein